MLIKSIGLALHLCLFDGCFVIKKMLKPKFQKMYRYLLNEKKKKGFGAINSYTLSKIMALKRVRLSIQHYFK